MAPSQAAGTFAGAFLFASLSVAAGPPAKEATRLEPGARVEGLLAPDGGQAFSIGLRAGHYLRVVVEQDHVDAVVSIRTPEGVVIGEADNRVDRGEPISLSVVSPAEGAHRVEVRLRGRSSHPGRYGLVATTPRAATADDEKRLAAQSRQAEGDRLSLLGSAESSSEALKRYQEAAAAWHESADVTEEATALSRLADALTRRGDRREGLSRAEQALALWRLVENRRGEAAALDQIGLAVVGLGEPRRGLEFLESALELRRASADLRGQAETLNDIAIARANLGELPEAIARYTQALELTRMIGDRFGEAMVLKNRATDSLGVWEPERALADLRQALRRFRELGDRREEGLTLIAIGNVDLQRNDARGALRHYRTALALVVEAGDRPFEGLTRNHMGLAHLQAKRPAPALKEFERARRILRECGDRRGEGMAMANIGRSLLEKREFTEARNVLTQAISQLRVSADGVDEAIAVVDLARTERALGDPALARNRLEEALRFTESLRGSIPAIGERASYMASTRDRYDLLIELLMELHAKEPGRGWDAEALHASERAKARSLVDLLAEARVDLREGAHAALLEEERSVEAQIERRRREDQRRLSGEANTESSEPNERSLGALLAAYQDVEGRLRAASPRFAALTRPNPLTLKEIREQISDGDTLLLEYSLGEERSFVWAVTRDTLASHELPGRKVIEAAARRLFEVWSVANAPDAPEADRRARALSRMLLGPVADHLRDRRIVVVAEGALQYIPFEALPSPREGDAAVPLVVAHEVVSLPSATTLAVLRHEASVRAAPEDRTVVLADPVFDRHDPRVAHGSASTELSLRVDDALVRSMKETGVRLARLPASRREARAIADFAGAGKSVVALDFEANRARAMSAEVSSARIVHFASHGLLNARHPELSGIVLSLVDEKGNPTDGFLQTRDIYKLRLSADLVVLSACQTALGKDVRGEGLMGLARGFMYAGAPRIVASLWQVPDRTTSELMKRFYEGVLRRGLRPAAALRAAQLSIRLEKRWSSPYYWAGFTLQGDWS